MREIIIPPEALDGVDGEPIPPGYKPEIYCMYRGGHTYHKGHPEFLLGLADALYRARVVKAE